MNAIAPLPLLARLADVAWPAVSTALPHRLRPDTGAPSPQPDTPPSAPLHSNDAPRREMSGGRSSVARLADARASRRHRARPGPEHAARTALSGERLARARLARTARIGPVTFHEMLGHFGSADAALAALPSLARKAGFASAPVPPAVEMLRREAEALARLGGRFIVLGDADYPALLAQIPDAPPLLAAIGDVGLLARSALAVVGARNASTNGRRLAATLASELGAAGVVVVSGLARGIDTAAHRAALDSGTVAVLAGGIDVIYPPENEDLYHAIAARGLILSEAPLGAQPQARHFPRRNRIVSGLSLGVLVVEAALQSGSLITARQAADQGREVFAIPGSPLDPRCRGTNRLIRDGAQLVETAADVLAQLQAPAPSAAAVTGSAAGLDNHHRDSAPAARAPQVVVPPLSVPVTEPVNAAFAFDETPLLAPDDAEAGPASPLPAPIAGAPLLPSINNAQPLPVATAGVLRPPGIGPAHPPRLRDAAPQSLEKSPDSLRDRILAELGRSPTPVDELIRECHVSAALVTAALLDLELSGKVERLQGNMVVLI